MEEITIQNVRLDRSSSVHPTLGKYRDTSRARTRGHRKYVFTDQIDQLVREIYLDAPGAKTRPGIRLLAKKVGMPHWALKKRARESWVWPGRKSCLGARGSWRSWRAMRG